MLRLILVAGLAACTSSAESTGISEVSCPTDSTLTYDNFGAAFITSNCLSRHTTRGPVLTSQVVVRSNSGEILALAVYTTAMPEDAEMSIDERALLGEWLACGAP
jgi:hypothetical protein